MIELNYIAWFEIGETVTKWWCDIYELWKLEKSTQLRNYVAEGTFQIYFWIFGRFIM